MMRYPWFDEYCLKKPGAQKDFKGGVELDPVFGGRKMFAAQAVERTGKRHIPHPEMRAGVRRLSARTFSGITAGYYMNKVHWNTVWFDKEEAPR